MQTRHKSHRTVLRRAIVDVLTNMKCAPYPTAAGPNVFDSKGDEVMNMAVQRQMPGILVYTDTEIGTPIVMNSWPFQWTVEVVIELMLGSDDPTRATSPDLEAQLDDLEFDVRSALFGTIEPDNRIKAAFSKLYDKVVNYRSIRMGNDNNNQRLAMRGIVVDLTYTDRHCQNVGEFEKLRSITMKTDFAQGVTVVTKDEL